VQARRDCRDRLGEIWVPGALCGGLEVQTDGLGRAIEDSAGVVPDVFEADEGDGVLNGGAAKT
jgi:hypothetical protein